MSPELIAFLVGLSMAPLGMLVGHLLGQRVMANRWRQNERFKKETAVRGTRMKRIRVRRRDGAAANDKTR